MRPGGRSASGAWIKVAEPDAPNRGSWLSARHPGRKGSRCLSRCVALRRLGGVTGPRLRVDGRDRGRARPARLC
jgi:hypothetical protein